MSTDAQPAAPSAVAPPPSLDTMTSEQRAQWRVTGEKPATDVAAESSPAPAADAQPVSTETSTPAASEPAKGKGVKARSAELDAEIAGLRDQLKLRAALREELSRPVTPDVPKAASSTATPQWTDVIRQPDLSQPMLTDQQFFDLFPDAPYGQYGVYTTKYLLAEDRAQAQQQSQRQSIAHTWAANLEAVRAEHPDFDVHIQDDALKHLPNTPTNQAIADALQESGNARLYYHLVSHVAELQRVMSLPPARALVELGKLDAQLGSPTRQTPKTLTDAPAPPPSLGARPAAPANELEAAIAAGDFRRYKELANARDIAAARR